MANKNLKTFNVAASMKVSVNIQIEAKDYQDALNKAKDLNEHDFIEMKGDYNDGEFLGIDYLGSNEPLKVV